MMEHLLSAMNILVTGPGNILMMRDLSLLSLRVMCSSMMLILAMSVINRYYMVLICMHILVKSWPLSVRPVLVRQR